MYLVRCPSAGVSHQQGFQTVQRLRPCLRAQGMSLVPAVTELMLAELLYLQYDNPTRPIFMYINSAGVQVCVLCLCLLMPKQPQPLAASEGHPPSHVSGARRKERTSWGTSRRRSPSMTP